MPPRKPRLTTLARDEMDAEELQHIEAGKKKEGEESALEDRDLRDIMALPQGRRLITRILNLTNHRGDPFVAGSQDITHRNIGKQSVGRTLEHIVAATCFQEYLTMLRENKERGERTDD